MHITISDNDQCVSEARTAPLKRKLTNVSQYHTRVSNTRMSKYTRVMHCLHASQNLQALNFRILACVLASTHKGTCEYLQTNSLVLAITRIGNNFCWHVMQLYEWVLGHVRDAYYRIALTTCWWYEEIRCNTSRLMLKDISVN